MNYDKYDFIEDYIQTYLYPISRQYARHINSMRFGSGHNGDFKDCHNPECAEAVRRERLIVGQAEVWAWIGLR